MIKVTGIIYFPIWLTPGLLKKNLRSGLCFNCKVSLGEDELSARMEGCVSSGQCLLQLTKEIGVRSHAEHFG